MSGHSDDFLRLAAEAKSRIREVSVEEARALVDQGALLLDVRDKEEFDQGHIEGAGHLSRGQLELRAHEVIGDKDRPTVVYCGGGNRSALAADTLRQLGYREVVSLRGGLRGYREATKP